MRPQTVAQGETGRISTAIGASADRPGSGDLLRFITCGSVDDGKSTLIGRLLFEAGAVFDDQLDALDRDSRKFGTVQGGRDFALLVDGLSAEREQGITIDVAYRYFATSRRTFIVADTPGHEQYTRNMATGASTADCAIILIDARLGVLPQTRRHSFIVALMGVRHIVVAVNKMDLVAFDEARFDAIAADYRQAVASLDFASIAIIPVSAREGDNISQLSARTPWYRGQALLPWLETVVLDPSADDGLPGILPVQYVNRPDPHFRGFAGTVAAGRLRQGEAVLSLPSGQKAHLARLVTADGDFAEVQAGQAVTLVLDREIDTSRGDVLVGEEHADRLRLARGCTARVLVTGETIVQAGGQYEMKLGCAMAQAVIVGVDHAVDIESFAIRQAQALPMNAIGRISLRLDRLVPMLPYRDNVVLGGFILIDRISRQTVAFGFIETAESAEAGADTTPKGQRMRSRIRTWLENRIGPADSALRRQRLRQASGLLAQSILLALMLAAVALPLSTIGAVVLVHAALSPQLKRVNDWLWHQRDTRPADVSVSDLGEGI